MLLCTVKCFASVFDGDHQIQTLMAVQSIENLEKLGNKILVWENLEKIGDFTERANNNF